MKLITTIVLLFLIITNSNAQTIKKENMKFYIGTYTNKDFSTSNGIYTSTINKVGLLSKIKLVATTDNPSYLTKTEDANYLIAANAAKEGTITSFKINESNLTELNKSDVEQSPCFITTYNGYILTANYMSATVNLHSIDANGKLSDKLDAQKHFVTTPSTHKRQKKAFAHSCYFEPNSNNIISVDLGANKIMFWTLDKTNQKLTPNTFSELELPKESGPRLITFHPTQPILYVINELSSTISILKKDVQNNSYSIVETINTLPEDFTGNNTAAHIEITKDGHYLYATNRGHDSIAVFKVNKHGELTLIERVSVHGEHPRNFSLSPDNQFLIVANRDTNNICSFKRDYKTGRLTFIDETDAPRATCILF